MTKQDKKEKLKLLQEEVKKLQDEIELYDKLIPMSLTIKGKFTIQLHPKSQLNNLKSNGWRIANERDLEEISFYFKS